MYWNTSGVRSDSTHNFSSMYYHTWDRLGHLGGLVSVYKMNRAAGWVFSVRVSISVNRFFCLLLIIRSSFIKTFWFVDTFEKKLGKDCGMPKKLQIYFFCPKGICWRKKHEALKFFLYCKSGIQNVILSKADL